MNRLPLCARIGILHGLIVGFFFGLWRLATGFAPLTAYQFTWGVLLLSMVALLCSLFILVIVERYLVGAVFWPALINSILVTLITTLLINVFAPHPFFFLLSLWIGILIGLLVGLVLCRLCLDRFRLNKD